MGFFEQFDLRDMEKSGQVDLTKKRREKLLAAIQTQVIALADALQEDDCNPVNNRNARAVRRWFKPRDNGYYIQCFYGPYALQLEDGKNALFVMDLHDVAEALAAFETATRSGVLDDAIDVVVQRMTDRSGQARYPFGAANDADGAVADLAMPPAY